MLAPRLNLNFTSETLDPRVTFTRAGATSTRVNSSGLVEAVAEDTPRFDFTLNSGGSCKGLLVEEQRTNIIQWSNNFTGTGWSVTKINGGELG